jgi:hypothetical protein
MFPAPLFFIFHYDLIQHSSTRESIQIDRKRAVEIV